MKHCMIYYFSAEQLLSAVFIYAAAVVRLAP
jgi:hypothetical protein